MFRSVSVCESLCVSVDVLGGQKVAADPGELVVSHPVWVLGIRLVLCKSSVCSLQQSHLFSQKSPLSIRWIHLQ